MTVRLRHGRAVWCWGHGKKTLPLEAAEISQVGHLEWSLVIKTTHSELETRSYIEGGLKVEVYLQLYVETIGVPEFSENPPWAVIRKMGVSWCEVWPQITARALIRKVKPGRWASNWKVYTSTTYIFEPFSWQYQPDRGSRTFSRYLLVQNHTMGVKPFNPTGGFDTGH